MGKDGNKDDGDPHDDVDGLLISSLSPRRVECHPGIQSRPDRREWRVDSQVCHHDMTLFSSINFNLFSFDCQLIYEISLTKAIQLKYLMISDGNSDLK